MFPGFPSSPSTTLASTLLPPGRVFKTAKRTKGALPVYTASTLQQAFHATAMAELQLPRLIQKLSSQMKDLFLARHYEEPLKRLRETYEQTLQTSELNYDSDPTLRSCRDLFSIVGLAEDFFGKDEEMKANAYSLIFHAEGHPNEEYYKLHALKINQEVERAHISKDIEWLQFAYNFCLQHFLYELTEQEKQELQSSRLARDLTRFYKVCLFEPLKRARALITS